MRGVQVLGVGSLLPRNEAPEMSIERVSLSRAFDARPGPGQHHLLQEMAHQALDLVPGRRWRICSGPF